MPSTVSSTRRDESDGQLLRPAGGVAGPKVNMYVSSSMSVIFFGADVTTTFLQSDTLIKYLLDELNECETSHADALNPL